jgi:AcrR family transcriptional regulator
MVARKTGGIRAKSADDVPTIDRIVSAAYLCFDKFGIRKTTIDDIAGQSELSRPTIYRYFAGKDDIVRHISALEIRKVNDELRRRISRANSFVDLLTESLLLTTRIAADNEFVRILIETSNVASRGADPNSAEFPEIRSVWHSLLAQGLKQGELANDLTEEDIGAWLALAETMLLLKVDSVAYTDAQLRTFIKRFVVAPVLTDPTRIRE